MLAGSLIAALVIAVPGLTSNFVLLEISAVLGGLGEAMYLSTWNSYLADTTTIDVRAETFSLSFMNFTIASGIGTFLPAFFPLVNVNFLTAHRITFVALGLFALVTSMSVQKWAVNAKPKLTREGILPRKSLGVILKFSTANMLIGLGAGLIIPLIPTWFLLRFGETDVFSGPLVAASNIIMGLTAVAAPTIAKRIGFVKGIVVTQAMSTIFLLAVPFSPSPYVAALLYVIRAVLMNMSSPLGDTFLMNMISDDERATASSFNVILWRLPNSASTVVGGSMLNGGNLNLPFYLCTAMYVTFNRTILHNLQENGANKFGKGAAVALLSRIDHICRRTEHCNHHSQRHRICTSTRILQEEQGPGGLEQLFPEYWVRLIFWRNSERNGSAF